MLTTVDTNATGTYGFAAGMGAFSPGDSVIFQVTTPHGGAVIADCKTVADNNGNVNAQLPGNLPRGNGVTVQIFDVTKNIYAEVTGVTW